MNTNTKNEPNVKQVVPLFAVSDIEQSLRFYVNGLGFTMTNKWMDDGKLRWCWLQLGGAAVMLQEFRKEGHDSWTPKGKVGEGISINFQCSDALTIYREVVSRGIEPKKPYVGNGMWVTGVSDPDGYALFFESATDDPEDTEYPENES
jgi:lactoylglutathione lyase